MLLLTAQGYRYRLTHLMTGIGEGETLAGRLLTSYAAGGPSRTRFATPPTSPEMYEEEKFVMLTMVGSLLPPPPALRWWRRRRSGGGGRCR